MVIFVKKNMILRKLCFKEKGFVQLSGLVAGFPPSN